MFYEDLEDMTESKKTLEICNFAWHEEDLQGPAHSSYQAGWEQRQTGRQACPLMLHGCMNPSLETHTAKAK